MRRRPERAEIFDSVLSVFSVYRGAGENRYPAPASGPLSTRRDAGAGRLRGQEDRPAEASPADGGGERGGLGGSLIRGSSGHGG